MLENTSRDEFAHALRSAFDASGDCIKLVGLDGRIEYMNERALAALEIDGESAPIGEMWSDLWPAAAKEHVLTAIKRVQTGNYFRFSAHRPTAKGHSRWWDVHASPVRGKRGEIDRILAISRDITREHKSAQLLRWASEHDALTGLPNRRAFEARLQSATSNARCSGSELGLLLVDLDHFKHVNDTLGHGAGDHLLKVLTSRLKRRLRGLDFVARMGGDEFAVIVENCVDDEHLHAVGSAICEEARKAVRYEHRTINTGCTIGGALFPRHAETAKELLRNADIALYARKREGRGGMQLFDSCLREEAQRVSSQLSLARGLSEKSVVPYYQRKVDLRDGRIVGFEALLRIRRARQVYKPSAIEAAFKDYELASKIGALMQRRVFLELRGWLDAGLQPGSVAINAAPAEFMRDDFAECMIGRLRHCRIPPSLIEVEVTEHALIDRGAAFVTRALNVLHDAGVRVALDDFGTGYSSLSHLSDFPVDVVKVDRSFIANMTSDHEVRAIVAAVIGLARKLTINVVAEGVENELQRSQLLSMGCNLGQGHLFAGAAAADAVEDVLMPRRSLVA